MGVVAFSLVAPAIALLPRKFIGSCYFFLMPYTIQMRDRLQCLNWVQEISNLQLSTFHGSVL